MFSKTTRGGRRWMIVAAIALGASLVTHLLGKIRFFQLVHLKAQDTQFVVRGPLSTPDIVLIVVDDKSLEHFKELELFWHPYYATAIKAAAEGGAKVLGLDKFFAITVTQWEKEHDQMMAEAIITTAPTMPVICGYVPSMMAKQKDWPVPINMIAGSLGQSAYANLTADPDDFIRVQELIESPPAKPDDPPPARGLALRVAEKFLGADVTFENGKLMLAGKEIPVNRDRTININYAGPPDTFPRVSLSDFVEAARAGEKDKIRKWVGGKAVLLGPDNIDDRHATPYYTFSLSGSSRFNTAGVEIHANTLRTLLQAQYLVPVPEYVRIFGLFFVAMTTAIVVVLIALGRAVPILLLGVFATAASTQYMFRAGRLISASEMLLSCLVSLLFSLVYRFFSAEKRGDLFRTAVSVFVGKRVATSLEETRAISLSGSRLDVTILFSDIRGFTAFCESKDPAVVVDLLNEYMANMVKVIVDHHGQVNKFIGDGILAIFSDEDGTKPGDHATRAVSCGAAMARVPGQFKTGVGIHSGPAVVGNVGSADKMEYTVLGDTVNLASRLESLNKENKTSILISEATRELMEDPSETLFLGAVPVRGKTEPMKLYTIASLYNPPKKEAVPAAEVEGAVKV
ncbi:MAG: adenylate/guanylate cyclase domain-containing protein [Bryobacterales bacterium]|nr:adenylate/guanylate cyclase domain-containing protein [Bryobacterales bacterium]